MRLRIGRAIDGAQPIQVTFEGALIEAYAGDTLASALMAAGRLAIGADKVTGRPRGLRWISRRSELSVRVGGRSGAFDPAHLVLEDGMKVRLAKGPGAPPTPSGALDPDILVVGAGPAGLIAAETASGGGARVLLVDRAREAGGALRWSGERVGRQSASDWCDSRVERLKSAGVEVMLGAEVLPTRFDEWQLYRAGSGAVRTVRARQTVLATGAVARMPIFSGNDIPGVMTASAMRQGLEDWGVVPGARIAVFSTGDEGRQTAETLRAAGVEVVAVVDVRNVPLVGDWPGYPRSHVRLVEGQDRVEAIEISGPGGQIRIACDGLAVAGGWSPQIGPLLGRVRPIWNPAISAWLIPPGSPRGVHPAGAAGGTYSTYGAMKSGFFRARKALAALNRVAPVVQLGAAEDSASDFAVYWHCPGPGPAFADFARGLTLADITKGAAADEVSALAGRYVADPRLT